MKKTDATGLLIALTALFVFTPTNLRADQSASPETIREAKSRQLLFAKKPPSPTRGRLGWGSQREARQIFPSPQKHPHWDTSPTGKKAGRQRHHRATGTMESAQSPSQGKTPGIPAAPYAGQQARAIKALSEKEIRGLLKGAGLGFAKAAELNHYPGPVHVIALASELGLTPAQSARVKALYAQMKSEAIPLGEQIIAREKHLDTLFATRRIDQTSLRAATARIGRLRGSLRAVHLGYHLKMKTLLTPHQTAAYDRLRGYGPGGPAMDHGKHGGQQR